MSPRKLSDSDRQEILTLYRETEATTSSLATQFGVSSSTISRFLKTSLTDNEYEELIQVKRLARSSRNSQEEKETKTKAKAKSTKAKSKPKTTKDKTTKKAKTNKESEVEEKKEEKTKTKAKSKAKSKTKTTKAKATTKKEKEKEQEQSVVKEQEVAGDVTPQGVETPEISENKEEEKSKSKDSKKPTKAKSTRGRRPRKKVEAPKIEETVSNEDAVTEDTIAVVEASNNTEDKLPEESQESIETIENVESSDEVVSEKIEEENQENQENQANNIIKPKLKIKTPIIASEPSNDSYLEAETEIDSEDEEEDLELVQEVAAMFGEDMDDGSDLDEEDDDDDDEIIEDTTIVEEQLEVLSLNNARFPRVCYLVIDRYSELVTKPMRDFAHLGTIPDSESSQRTLPIFDNHKVAKRFCVRKGKVIKVPDGRVLQKTSNYLQDKGISRILMDGKVYSL